MVLSTAGDALNSARMAKARVDMVKRLIFITFRKKLGLDLFAIIVHEGSISC